MKKTFGFGLVGCGMIARFHAEAIDKLPNARVAAAFSRSSANAERLARPRDAKVYTDLSRFLADPAVDFVNICTPSGAHLEPALAAAAAGKHVIVEKPLEITLARCDRIIEACRTAGVNLVTIFPSRFADNTTEVRRALADGRFGILSLGDAYVKWYRPQTYYDSGQWRGTWDLDGGGALMNQSIHAIDLLQWFMGPLESIKAYTATRAHERIEVEDVGVAVLRFASGALGVIEGTTAAYPGFLKRLEIHGSKGSAVLEESDILTWSFEEERPEDADIRSRFAARQSGGGGAADPAAISCEGHRRQLEDFLEAFENNGNVLCDGSEGRKAVEIILAIYRSQNTGSEVTLPLPA